MYFVFNSKIISWHNQTLQALVQGGSPQYEPHWWNAEPLISKPLSLTFAVNSKAPLLDNYFTGSIEEFYSIRLIELLREAGVKFETFPVNIIDRKTRQPLSLQYAVFHLLEIYSALDKEQSDLGNSYIRKLVLTKEILEARKPLFRIKERFNLAIIHKDLKDVFDAANINGCEYIPLDQFRVGVAPKEVS